MASVILLVALAKLKLGLNRLRFLSVVVEADEPGAAEAVEQLFIEKDLIGGGHERLNRVRMS